MSKIVNIPFMVGPDNPNRNTGRVYTKETFDEAINSEYVQEMIKTKRFYLLKEKINRCSDDILSVDMRDILAPIVKINYDSIDVEVEDAFDTSIFNDCKAGIMCWCSINDDNEYSNLRIMSYELIRC